VNNISSAFEGIGTTGLVALGALVLVELALMVAALISVLRRPPARLRGPKWLWVLVILFVNLVGPILYFALARKPEAIDIASPPDAVQPHHAEAVADVLYGSSAPEDEV